MPWHLCTLNVKSCSSHNLYETELYLNGLINLQLPTDTQTLIEMPTNAPQVAFITITAFYVVLAFLWIMPEMNHSVTTNCQVTECNKVKVICGFNNMDVCNSLKVSYQFDDEKVTRARIHTIYRTETCPDVGSTVQCFYNDQNVDGSLSLVPEDRIGKLVVILIALYVLSLTLMCIVVE